MDDTYEAQAFCCNCAFEGPITAPVGHLVHSQSCPLCRCSNLRPVAQREWERDKVWPNE